MHYRALELVDPVAKLSARKLCLKSKSQKNVPANNCHSKVGKGHQQAPA